MGTIELNTDDGLDHSHTELCLLTSGAGWSSLSANKTQSKISSLTSSGVPLQVT